MKTLKIIISVIFGVTLTGLVSCSSTSSLPNDEVYYTPGEQINTTVHYTKKVNTSSSKASAQQNTYGNYSQGKVLTDNNDGNNSGYTEDDDYYDGDYTSRIKRFHQSDNSSFDYYDDYYTDGYDNDCYCGGSNNPNVNISLGFGVGYAGSWGFGFGWGYPYYGWGYPYYGWGYPYYGWGGYWSGYNAGYWNGYWDGYYGYPPYYGGPYYPYYPDYGYRGGYGTVYRPRGNRTGGSNLPRYTGTRGGTGIPSGNGEKTVVAGSGTFRGGNNISSGDQRVGSREYVNTSVGYRQKPVSNEKITPASENRLKKPETGKTNVRQTPVKREKTKVQPRYSQKGNSRSSYQRYSKEQTRQRPKYSKPKQYQRLDTKQPRNSKEYYRPKTRTRSNVSNRNNVSSQKRYNTKQQNTRQYAPQKKNVYRPSQSKSRIRPSGSSTKGSSGRVKSYSSPRRTTSSPRSYSSPSRSSGSSSGSSSRSYSSPSRSSYSGGGSRSSGSSTPRSSSSSRGGGIRR